MLRIKVIIPIFFHLHSRHYPHILWTSIMIENICDHLNHLLWLTAFENIQLHVFHRIMVSNVKYNKIFYLYFNFCEIHILNAQLCNWNVIPHGTINFHNPANICFPGLNNETSSPVIIFTIRIYLFAFEKLKK